MTLQKIPKEQFDSKKHVKEFKRKCNQCGKIWHVLESREKQLRSHMAFNAFQQTTNCCNPGASLQAKRNIEANETELEKLRKCPECHSSDYAEQVLIHEKKN